jgi:endonuclease-3
MSGRRPLSRLERSAPARASRRLDCCNPCASVGATKKATAKARRQHRVKTILERLRRAIPTPRIELDYRDPWQLLVATILSARSTDRIVNRVTAALYRRFPTPAALAAGPQAEVEAIVRPTGFFHNKARSIREVSAALVERFAGDVPRDIDDLVQLPGVARKTANVVLGVAHGVSAGVLVDTHVGRVAGRLGLTRSDDPGEIERDLCVSVPRSQWIQLGLRLQLHGRYVCTARSPRCPRCPLNEVCPSREASAVGTWQDRALAESAVVEGGAGAPARDRA